MKLIEFVASIDNLFDCSRIFDTSVIESRSFFKGLEGFCISKHFSGYMPPSRG